MDEEIKRSDFNEAALKMVRIHKLQEIINLSSLNKLGLYQGPVEYGLNFSGKRNFEVIFECLNQLLMEAWAKCTDKEQENAINFRDILREFMRSKPVYLIVPSVSGREQQFFNDNNWVLIEKALSAYESDVRSLIDKHGFAGKEVKDTRKAVTN